MRSSRPVRTQSAPASLAATLPSSKGHDTPWRGALIGLACDLCHENAAGQVEARGKYYLLCRKHLPPEEKKKQSR